VRLAVKFTGERGGWIPSLASDGGGKAMYSIETYSVGGIGHYADIIEYKEDGMPFGVVHSTRIYRTAEDAAFVARAWIEENR
jgi:hypothetical protein